MKGLIGILMTGVALFALSGCSGGESSKNMDGQSRVVEESEMPYTYEERQHAAVHDSDLGKDSRRAMDRVNEDLRKGGEDLKRGVEHGKDAVEDVITGRDKK